MIDLGGLSWKGSLFVGVVATRLGPEDVSDDFLAIAAILLKNR